MSRTLAEIQSDIDDVRAAISAVVKGGKSYTINSGGSSRMVTQADLDDLRSLLADYQKEYNAVAYNEELGFNVGVNW